MLIFQEITDKKSLLLSRYLISILLRLKTAIYKSRQQFVSPVAGRTDADDWIIGGQSLSAHCKRMRYVEKIELNSVAQTESVASIQDNNAISKICNDLLEPVVL